MIGLAIYLGARLRSWGNRKRKKISKKMSMLGLDNKISCFHKERQEEGSEFFGELFEC